MKTKKKKFNFGAVLIFIIALIIAVSSHYVFSQFHDMEVQSREQSNYCGSDFSCQCKDLCARTDGYSNYYSWYFHDNECWCIDQNQTSRRVF